MLHLGDITKLDGHKVFIPDCVIGGSPCQGLSAAGKRGGLDDDRSGLFINQVKIIKEMREEYVRCFGRSNNIRPRYMVWENVPGALSTGSPKGEDFRIVLEETAKVADENAVIPEPPKGKWSNAGCIMGNGWSIAWRIFDNQFWGTPQRRRRIALVADFGGESAPEILFVRKGLSGDLGESQQAGKGTAADLKRGVGADDQARKLWGGAIGADVYNLQTTGDTVCTLTAGGYGSTGTSPKVIVGFDAITFGPGVASREGECYGFPLRANAGDNQMTVAYSVENHPADSRVDIDESGKVQTLTSRMGTGGGNVPMVLEGHQEKTKYIVRRLTPLECERLQGFPDYWTDIGEYIDSKGKVRKTSDAARYKALGNSIALPAWKWIIKRISAQYERDATMVSLFDGIGGFPLLWEQINGIGSCIWASEIEDFPIAVTKKRLGVNHE